MATALVDCPLAHVELTPHELGVAIVALAQREEFLVELDSKYHVSQLSAVRSVLGKMREALR